MEPSGATARTELAQADASPTILDTSPCEGRIQIITPVATENTGLV